MVLPGYEQLGVQYAKLKDTRVEWNEQWHVTQSYFTLRLGALKN